ESFVAEAEQEALESVMRVDAHDVPDDRPAADLDHRLRTVLGLFPQTGAPPAAQDHDRDLRLWFQRRHGGGTDSSGRSTRAAYIWSAGVAWAAGCSISRYADFLMPQT